MINVPKVKSGTSVLYFGNFIFSVLFGFIVLNLTPRQLGTRVLFPESDQFTDYVFARNFYWTNNFFEFPGVGGLPNQFSNYPIAVLFDSRKWALIGTLIKFGFSPIAAVNIGLISTFALVSTSMLLLLRFLKIETWLSFGLATCFAFLPWHILRSVHGFTFADYSVVPATIYLIIRLGNELTDSRRINLNNRWEYLRLIGLTIWIATSGSYYIYFSFLLIGICLIFLLLGRNKIFKSPNNTKRILSVFVLSITFSVLAQFIFWKLAISRESVLQPLPKSITDNFNFGLLPFSLFLPIFNSLETFPISRISIALENWRPQSFCLEDHLSNGFMKLTCSVNFESLAFPSVPAALISCTALIFVIKRISNLQGASLAEVNKSGRVAKSRVNPNSHQLAPEAKSASSEKLLSVIFLGAIAISAIGGFGLFFAALYPNFRVYGRMSIFITGLGFVLFGLESLRIKRKSQLKFLALAIVTGSLMNSMIFIQDLATYKPLNSEIYESVTALSAELRKGCTVLVLPVVNTLYPFQDISKRSEGQFPYEGAMLYVFGDTLKYDPSLTVQSFENANELMGPQKDFDANLQRIKRSYCGFVYVGSDLNKSYEIKRLVESSILVDKRNILMKLQNGKLVTHSLEGYKF